MTVYDIQHITVEEMGDPVRYYRIRTVDGYVIKLPIYEENEYKTVAILTPTYDFNTVQIIPISELPEDAVIHGDTGNAAEVM
jgi:hypothetical protein